MTKICSRKEGRKQDAAVQNDVAGQKDKRIECRTKDAAGQNNKYGIKLLGKTNIFS